VAYRTIQTHLHERGNDSLDCWIDWLVAFRATWVDLLRKREAPQRCESA
jgi:hypothetical protein